MNGRRLLGATLVFAATLGQDKPAPPTVALRGVTNAASHMPAELPAGSLAPGSLARIEGWRFGETLAELRVVVRQNGVEYDAQPVRVGAEGIFAVLPKSLSPGKADLIVMRNGQPSVPAPIRIVESSFGAFTRNGRGWGPGEIRNADTTENSLTRGARPATTITLFGTGIQATDSVEAIVGARTINPARIAAVDGRPGVKALEIPLPADVPEGCYVPIRVRNGAGVVSNTVSVAVARDGGPCVKAGNWMASEGRQSGHVGMLILAQVDFFLVLGPQDKADFRMDLGYANFEAHQSGDQTSPIYMFPPIGACLARNGDVDPLLLRSPTDALDRTTGRLLDAAPKITISGHDIAKELMQTDRQRLRYGHVIGGLSPLMGAKQQPRFLWPGEYEFAAPAGKEVGAFRAKVRVQEPIVWKNRSRVTMVDRAKGVTLEWKAPRPDGLVVITVINADHETGTTGFCTCVERASAGQFHIPPDALANIPATSPRDFGVPMNMIFVAETPFDTRSDAKAEGLDRLIVFSASISGRSVDFR